MKKIVIVFLVFFTFVSLNAKDSSEFKKTAAGVGFMFGNQPSTESVSLELKIHELLNDKFILGFDTFFGIPFDDTTPGLAAIKPSLGIFGFGDSKSNFKSIISVSSGIAVTTLESPLYEDETYYGTISTVDIHLIYKNYGLTLTGFTINTNNYYNSGGNIGLKFWF